MGSHFQGMRVCHSRKHQAWWLKQEVESSHPELQSWSWESKLGLAEVFRYSMLAPNDDFLQEGHTSQAFHHTSQAFPTLSAGTKNSSAQDNEDISFKPLAPQSKYSTKSPEGKCLRSWGPRGMEISRNGRNDTNYLKIFRMDGSAPWVA